MAKIIKMMDLLKKEGIELGKVYTDKDMPPFKVNEDENPCWKGYKQLGMKEKDGKQVPNCVPIDEINEGKADKSFLKIIGFLRKESRRLNDDDSYELSTKLKAWFNKNVM